jgi:DNA-binding transcriptional MocR family regulator
VAALIYRPIADNLRLRIESGVFAPGSKLPTVVALRDRYQVSRNTIRDALKWLLNRGLVEVRHGQGTFVASSLKPFTTTLSSDWRVGTGPGGGERAGGGDRPARDTKQFAAPGRCQPGDRHRGRPAGTPS